jgi:hypothetical protein
MGAISGGAGMKARGKLAVFAAITALLMVSTSFSERRNVKTWAPNAVIAEPKPTDTRMTLAARPDPATIALNSNVEKAAAAPEQQASDRAESAGVARASMAIIDPEATAALPTQPGPELSAAPRLNNKWQAQGRRV